MSYICIRCKNISHLHNADFLSFHSKMDGALASCKAAAEYNYLISYFFFLFIVVVYDHYILSVQSRDRRYQRSGTCCDDQCVWIFLFCIFFCHRCGSTDLYTSLSCQKLIGSRKLVHLMLKWQGLLAFQDSAQSIFFLTKDDLMASSCCCVSCVQTARAAACHKDFFLDWCRLHFIAFHLTADQRINRTSSCGSCRSLCHTGKASQALYDLLVSVFHDFSRKERICEKCSCHVNDVGLSLSDDLLHLCRIVQSADSCYRNGNMFFDLGSKVNVAAVLLEHGRMCVAKTSLISSC